MSLKAKLLAGCGGLPTDPYFKNVSLLLPGNGSNGAQNNTFVDSSPSASAVSRNGNTTQGSFTPYGSNWSNYFDGSGDYLAGPTNTAFDFGSGDFTVEAWICMTALPSLNASSERVGAVMAYTGGTVTANQGWEFYINATTNQLSFSSWGTANRALCSFTPVIGTWYHLAATRSGGTARLFINGVSQTLTTNSLQTNTDANANIRVGTSRGDTGYDHDFPGYISNARVVKGTAVYTANFTPPTAPLTAISGTSLLTCQSNRFRDNSSNAFAITVNGNTAVQKFSPFSPASVVSYNQSDITNWSGWFNGGTDRLQVPVTSNMYLGTTYTIEAWVYYNSTSYGARPIFNEMEPFQGGFAYLGLGMNTSGQFVFDYRPATSGAVTTITGPTVTPNTWHHIAVSNNATSAKMFVNGVQVGSTTTIGDYPSAKTNTVAVGGWGSGWNDGGIPAAAWIGYISNLRVVKGTAVYTANFTPPTSPLTAISGTVLLTCQNAAFTDNSSVNNILTPVTTATVTGNSPFNTTGYWSNYFDGAGDYLSGASWSSAGNFGTSDFTVECWVYATGAPQSNQVIWSCNIYPNSTGLILQYAGSGATQLNVSSATGAVISASAGWSFNQWHHIAVVRSGTTLTLYVDGVSRGSATFSNNCTDGLQYIGRPSDVANYMMQGYISNFRIVKGTAVYTGAFTPPTTPLTAISGTSLLTCQNGRFIDNSTNAYAITVNGDTSIQPYNPFYTATIASNGGSMYFDGSGDYLSMPQSVGYLGAGDWTLECWAYATATPPNYASLLNKNWTFSLATGDFQWSIKHSDGYMSFAYVNGSIVNVTTTIAPNINAWTHYAVTRSGTSLRIYANGVLNTTATLPSGFSFGTASSVPVYSGYNSRDNCYYTGYISGMRITEGSALYTSSTYTVPTAPQTPTAATTLLLNGMNAGIYDATTINDMETVGNAQVSTAQSKFGGSSMYFDGTGDSGRIAVNQPALQFGTSNFTAEGWIYSTGGTGTYQHILTGGTSWTTGSGGIYWYYNSGSPTLGAAWNQIATNPAVNSGTLSINTWYHFALVRNGNTMTLYINGTSVSSINVTGVSLAFNNQSRTNIGGGGWDQDFAGYIDDLRVTAGVARYTANFTPPTSAFANQ